MAAGTIDATIGNIKLVLALKRPRKIPIACRPLHNRMPCAAVAIFAVMVAVILVFANAEHDPPYFGTFFAATRGSGLQCLPMFLGEVAYSLLTTKPRSFILSFERRFLGGS